jgi:hypothetical protein
MDLTSHSPKAISWSSGTTVKGTVRPPARIRAVSDARFRPLWKTLSMVIPSKAVFRAMACSSPSGERGRSVLPRKRIS